MRNWSRKWEPMAGMWHTMAFAWRYSGDEKAYKKGRNAAAGNIHTAEAAVSWTDRAGCGMRLSVLSDAQIGTGDQGDHPEQ